MAKANELNHDVGQTSLALKTLVKKVRRHDEKSEYGPQVRNRSPERQLLHQLLFFYSFAPDLEFLTVSSESGLGRNNSCQRRRHFRSNDTIDERHFSHHFAGRLFSFPGFSQSVITNIKKKTAKAFIQMDNSFLLLQVPCCSLHYNLIL